MYIVIRRGAFEDLAVAGGLTGAAAVRCVREFDGDPDLAAWRPRPGKVVLRARGGQWDEVVATERHAAAGDGVIALPPRRRSERGPLLERMQAMTSELTPPPEEAANPRAGAVTYVVNPRVEMSSGKTLAQIAHAAVMAADAPELDEWVEAGCPAQVVKPPQSRFDSLCESGDLAARVEDAGLTEVPPGTITVLALRPA